MTNNNYLKFDKTTIFDFKRACINATKQAAAKTVTYYVLNVAYGNKGKRFFTLTVKFVDTGVMYHYLTNHLSAKTAATIENYLRQNNVYIK